jgi:hypothetical protein
MKDSTPYLTPSNRELRKFALKLGIFFAVFGAIWLRGQWAVYGYWIGSWAAVLGAFLVFPKPLSPLRRALIRLGRWLGLAFTFLILAAIYGFVLIPLGLAAKLFGKKFLVLGPDPKAPTYWIRLEGAAREKSDWEKQY